MNQVASPSKRARSDTELPVFYFNIESQFLFLFFSIKENQGRAILNLFLTSSFSLSGLSVTFLLQSFIKIHSVLNQPLDPLKLKSFMIWICNSESLEHQDQTSLTVKNASKKLAYNLQYVLNT